MHSQNESSCSCSNHRVPGISKHASTDIGSLSLLAVLLHNATGTVVVLRWATVPLQGIIASMLLL